MSNSTLYFIYKTTCLITGNFYIGMHSTSNVNDGYLGSGKVLKRSINKHGVEHHVREIIEFCETRQQLIERERDIVNTELLKLPGCMNLKIGGEGGFCEGMDIDYVSRNKKCGKRFSQKIKSDTELLNQFKNRAHQNLQSSTAQQKARNSKIEKYGKLGWINAWPEGSTHSNSSKDKISSAMQGKFAGENNPNFGKRNKCVSKDGVTKRIPLDKLDEYISNGWVIGIKK